MDLIELNTLDKVKGFVATNQYYYSHAKPRPLFQALELGFDDIFFYLFDHAEVEDQKNCVPYAVRYGRIEPLRYIYKVTLNSNPNKVTLEERPLIYEASIAGHVDVLDVLVQLGLSIDNPKNGVTPLMQACSHSGESHLGFIERLLELDADVHVTDKKGNTALSLAVDNDLVGVVHRLFIAGATIDVSLLHMVASSRKNRVDMLTCLLGYLNVSQLNQQNQHGYTALMLAVRAGVLANVQCLLLAGADTTLVNNSGKNAAFFAKGDIAAIFS